jgi:hypothetical protein
MVQKTSECIRWDRSNACYNAAARLESLIISCQFAECVCCIETALANADLDLEALFEAIEQTPDALARGRSSGRCHTSDAVAAGGGTFSIYPVS